MTAASPDDERPTGYPLRPYKLVVWLIPLLAVMAVAFLVQYQRSDVLRDTEEIVSQTADHFAQHALNVFETHELVARRVDDHISTMSWHDITASRELRGYLREIQDTYPQVQAIWLADATGAVRNGSRELPPATVSVADRDYYLALRANDLGTFIGDVVAARVMAGLNFNLARRRHAQTAGFDGIIIVTVFPTYFERFWIGSAPLLDTAVTLVRQDGAMLARIPGLNRERLTLGKDSPLMQAIGRGERGRFRAASTVDGVERLYAYRKVGRFNVYLGYGVGSSAVVSERRDELVFPIVFVVIAGVGLESLAVVALRRARREQDANLRFQSVSRDLVREAQNRADAEARLLASERKLNQLLRAQFAALVESAQHCIAEIGLDGTLRSMNPGGTQMFGYLPDEIVDRPWSVLIAPHRAGQLQTVLETIFKGQQGAFFETEGMRKDGTRIDVAVALSPIRGESSGITGASFLARDVTERRQAEDAVRKLNQELELRVAERTADLEQANAELETFSYSVSHDLRAPLAVINGFSDRLLQKYEGALDDEIRRYLVRIRANVIHMGHLIDDILSFSHMARREMTMAPVNMAELAREVFEEVRAAAPERKFVLRVGELPPASGDRTMIRQVLVNLLANAVKYTRPRAEAIIEVDGFGEGGQNTYRITDNGVGFDMQYADKLFGAFQRLHGTGEFEGTGLGLAIAKRIVVRHGGRVWAEAKVDAGASFYFTLPSLEKIA